MPPIHLEFLPNNFTNLFWGVTLQGPRSEAQRGCFLKPTEMCQYILESYYNVSPCNLLRPGLENGFHLPLVPGEISSMFQLKQWRHQYPINPSIHPFINNKVLPIAINLYIAITILQIKKLLLSQPHFLWAFSTAMGPLAIGLLRLLRRLVPCLWTLQEFLGQEFD